jgi:Type IV secretion system pilin
MFKKTTLTKYFLILIFLGGFLFASPLFALNLKDSFTSKSGLDTFADQSGYSDRTKTPEDYIGLLLTGFFSVLGIIAIALLIYSGFVWMTARGNESKVTKAKENIINIIIGLIFIIGSYALTAFILKIFT